jgi:hypothetical protein
MDDDERAFLYSVENSIETVFSRNTDEPFVFLRRRAGRDRAGAQNRIGRRVTEISNGFGIRARYGAGQAAAAKKEPGFEDRV